MNNVNWNEVSKFFSLLRQIIQEKLEALSSKEKPANTQEYEQQCVSRFLRSPSNIVQMESWLTEISTELNKENEQLSEKREKLSKELKELLRLIPSCVQV